MCPKLVPYIAEIFFLSSFEYKLTLMFLVVVLSLKKKVLNKADWNGWNSDILGSKF